MSSTKDPNKSFAQEAVFALIGEPIDTPQATKPVDELMDYFASYVYKDRHPIPLGACKELAEYFDRLISNQVASAVKEVFSELQNTAHDRRHGHSNKLTKCVLLEEIEQIATLNGVTK